MFLFCFMFIYASVLVTRTSSLVLDRSNDTAVFHSATFWGHDDFTIPLSSIDHAEVQLAPGDSCFDVVLKNGDVIELSAYDQKPGKGRAAHAVNEYIGREE
jgi:hypothetical protein